MNDFIGERGALLRAGHLLNQSDIVIGVAVNMNRVNTGVFSCFAQKCVDRDAKVFPAPKRIGQTLWNRQCRQFCKLLNGLGFIPGKNGCDDRIFYGIAVFNVQRA